MALTITVRLRTGRYDAADMNPKETEWPPAPARVFCALVASAAGQDRYRDVLEEFERLDAPEIWASPRDEVTRLDKFGYVVTNTMDRKAGNQNWPGRTNGVRQRTGVTPSSSSFAFVWPQADMSDSDVKLLNDLAWDIPYIGRSTSDVEVVVESRLPEKQSKWTVWDPFASGLDTSGAAPSHVPYRGYLAALEKAFEVGNPAWSAPRRTVHYRECGSLAPAPAPPEASQSPYRDFIVLGFDSTRVPLPYEDAMRVSEVFRAAVIDSVHHAAGYVPSQVSGHDANGISHVAYTALPHVGGPHADGHLLGVAAAVPSDMSKADRRALFQGLVSITHLGCAAGKWRFPVEHIANRRRPWGLTPHRWCEHKGEPTARWVTATPLMLDRYPQPRSAVAARVSEAIQCAGYPAPVEIEILTGPVLTGAGRTPRTSTSTQKRPRRPTLHCRVTFDAPITGPVLAGALRYLGIGLFVPDPAS